VDAAGFDPVAYTKKLHDEAPLRMTFKATLAASRTVAEGIAGEGDGTGGRISGAGSPLDAQTLEIREFPSYRRERFVIQSRPGFTFWLPADAERRKRAACFGDLPAGHAGEWTTSWESTRTGTIAR